ncbi:MAG: hypothetical protein NTW41_01615 [Verrucomicrobia bacterium]|nr:hypothetical protein [Verrucomicrobiota bacterium]
MFTYRDKQSTRHSRIRSFLKTDPFVAVILSAIDFEWTVRRAILGLSGLPTKPIHEIFKSERSGGLSGLQNHWKKLVKSRLGSDLASIVPNWEFFSNRAFGLRNKLVHGAEGRVTPEHAGKIVDSILAGSVAVANYAEANNATIFGKKIRRLKTR